MSSWNARGKPAGSDDQIFKRHLSTGLPVDSPREQLFACQQYSSIVSVIEYHQFALVDCIMLSMENILSAANCRLISLSTSAVYSLDLLTLRMSCSISNNDVFSELLACGSSIAGLKLFRPYPSLSSSNILRILLYF